MARSAAITGTQPGIAPQTEPRAAAPNTFAETAKTPAQRDMLPEASVPPPVPAAAGQAAPAKFDATALSPPVSPSAPPIAASQRASHPGDAPPSSAPPLAAQLAPALVHIAATPDGSQRVTIKLTPAELGELRVHIERPRDGAVQVVVEATRPETLQLLRQDQPALHRALDQAGFPPDGRVVLLQQITPGSSENQDASSGTGSALTGEGGGDRSGGRSWDGPGQERGAGHAAEDQPRRRNAWLRAGINITA